MGPERPVATAAESPETEVFALGLIEESGQVGKANAAICFVSVQNARGMPDLRCAWGRARCVVAFFGCENLHADSGQETWTVKEDGSANAGQQVFVGSKLRDERMRPSLFCEPGAGWPSR